MEEEEKVQFSRRNSAVHWWPRQPETGLYCTIKGNRWMVSVVVLSGGGIRWHARLKSACPSPHRTSRQQRTFQQTDDVWVWHFRPCLIFDFTENRMLIATRLLQRQRKFTYRLVTNGSFASMFNPTEEHRQLRDMLRSFVVNEVRDDTIFSPRHLGFWWEFLTGFHASCTTRNLNVGCDCHGSIQCVRPNKLLTMVIHCFRTR